MWLVQEQGLFMAEAEAARRKNRRRSKRFAKVPRREDPDAPVERPLGTRVVLERGDSNTLTIRYRSSRGWVVRTFLFAWLWLGVTVLPALAWSWQVYETPVFLVVLGVLSSVTLIQWLVARAGIVHGVIMPYLLMVAAFIGLAVLLGLAGRVLARNDMVRWRPFVIGALWFIGFAFAIHWFRVRFGRGEVRVDPQKYSHTTKLFSFSRARRCRTDRIMAIGSRRPRPYLRAPYPRWGFRRFFPAYWFRGPLTGIAVVAAVFVSVGVLGGVEEVALRVVSVLIGAVYVVAIIFVSRPAYPVIVHTRRYAYRFGHYLTKDEQRWITYELRKFMEEIGHPVKRSLYRP